MRNPEPTVRYTVAGDSMDCAGILTGDRVLVDRELVAKDGDIVAAYLSSDGSTIKRLRLEDGVPVLLPESTNPWRRPCRVERQDGFSVLGAVTSVIRQLRGAEHRLRSVRELG